MNNFGGIEADNKIEDLFKLKFYEYNKPKTTEQKQNVKKLALTTIAGLAAGFASWAVASFAFYSAAAVTIGLIGGAATIILIALAILIHHSIKSKKQIDFKNDAVVDLAAEQVHKAVSGPYAEANGLIEQRPQLKQVSAEVVLKLQKDLVVTNQKYGVLELETIQKEGHLPEHMFVLGKATYYFSNSFRLGTNDAVFALVQIENKVYPRTFYRSNSQATWRTMPAAIKYNGYEIGRLGKGICEEDTQLPIEVNLALYSLPPPKNEFGHGMMQFHVQSGKDFTTSYKENINVAKSFIELEKDAQRAFVKGVLFVPRCPDPKAIILKSNKEQYPDFSKTLWEQEFNDPYYKKVRARIFASEDKTLQYMYYELEDGKAFLASVEKVKNNPISRYGNRKEALGLKGMDAPLLEYFDQIPQAYNPKEVDHGAKYQSNWNFVRECTLVQMYYQGQGRQIPDPV